MRIARWLTIAASATLLHAGMDMPKAKVNPAFEKMKTLVGTWTGQAKDGKTASIEYKLVSAGSALMESIDEGGPMNMITMYHPDGDRLMMTHYCAANNQPRMRAEPMTGEIGKVVFKFVDCSNLDAPTTGHMSGLAVTFKDADHFTQEWTWNQDGKDGVPEVFNWVRKK